MTKTLPVIHEEDGFLMRREMGPLQKFQVYLCIFLSNQDVFVTISDMT